MFAASGLPIYSARSILCQWGRQLNGQQQQSKGGNSLQRDAVSMARARTRGRAMHRHSQLLPGSLDLLLLRDLISHKGFQLQSRAASTSQPPTPAQLSRPTWVQRTHGEACQVGHNVLGQLLWHCEVPCSGVHIRAEEMVNTRSPARRRPAGGKPARPAHTHPASCAGQWRLRPCPCSSPWAPAWSLAA